MQSNQLGQFLLTGVPGPELDADTARRFKALQPGGFILFGRNIKSPEQLRKLIDDLRDLSDIEPIITIDQEGGRVSRLRLIGAEPPNAQALRQKGDRDLIKQHGKLTGQILRLFGFNLNLCPVLDISYDDQADNSLKGRCYGNDAQQVVDFAGTFNRAMRREGILSCGKHFPTYGSADVDPHEKLPVIHRTKKELLAEELIPFTALMPELDSMMIGHAWFPDFDADRPRWPSSLSHNIIQKLLRDQLGFDNGLVMTDDLDMGAILDEVTFEQAIQDAMRAGNDIVMICHRIEMVEQAHKHLAALPESLLNTALERVQRAKGNIKKPAKWSMERFAGINAEIQELRVAVLGEEKAAQLSVEDGKRSPVELY
ncbi:MAG TPA: glycoside hydrolase family 3 N-terminal domain-containing protein [Verrucomicrobiales bacterium]|jgi:beta-N-acetylhexosaminidase|nr:glycoside hydrolase family 3 N-terminal domain-containing protein [Verrucomicrobiales bacterium]